jgi:hypothetical protein
MLTENFGMRRIAPSSQQYARPYVPENHRVCDLTTTWLSFPIAHARHTKPLVIWLFSKLKIKLKG